MTNPLYQDNNVNYLDHLKAFGLGCVAILATTGVFSILKEIGLVKSRETEAREYFHKYDKNLDNCLDSAEFLKLYKKIK